jgi:Cu(I)/Ag(I) efflux system membrane fusion protein
MVSNGLPASVDPAASESNDHQVARLTRWQKLRLVVKVVELRVRFIALLAATGFAFVYWDTLWNRYDKWRRPSADHYTAATGLEFFCPMHPQVVQVEPGACPICGMTLAKRSKGEKPRLPAGLTARVELAPSRVAQAGIKTTEVTYAPLAQTLTTVGYVAFDERRMATIVSKVPGKSRVEVLHVNVTGQEVKIGQPLAELYSPELAQAIQEMVTAAKSAGGEPDVQTALGRSLLLDRRELARASAQKLERFGLTQQQIDDILREGKTGFTIPILSPIRGHVFKKVVQGQEVPEGYPMFELVDLSTVWVQAQVYEQQLGLVHVGQSVEASVEAFPGESFAGRVEFIQPRVDPATRTVEVRYSLENHGRRLLPGMFATVVLKTPVAETPAFQSRIIARATSDGTNGPASGTAEEQRTCPVTSAKLGSMGTPVLVQVSGRKIWTCCSACPPKLTAEPAKYLARLASPPQDQVLSVPESAVIDTGSRKVVFVESEPGVFEGRQVVLGPRIGDRFPVLEGLGLGDKVVADGTFLIDAESRINPGAAPADSGGPPKVPDAPPRTAARPGEGSHRH